MLKGYIDGVPIDIDEAAKIDGATRLIGQFRVVWSQTMAAVVIASTIPGLLYLLMQRFLVSGLTEGAMRE